MADSAGGFFYELNIKSNLSKSKNDIKAFERATVLTSRSLKTLGIIGAGLTGAFAGVNKVSKEVKALNVASDVSGESIETIKQYGIEFKLLGLEAQEGEELVGSLAQKLIEFEKLGGGNVDILSRLGVSPSDFKNIEDLIAGIREASKKDPDLLRALGSQIGLSNQQISYIFEDDETIAKNRVIAIQLSSKYNEVIEESSEAMNHFNKSIGIASERLSLLGLDIGSDLFKGIANIIDFYSDTPTNLKRVREDVVKSNFFSNEYTGAFAKGVERDINFVKGLFTGELFREGGYKWISEPSTSTIKTDNRTYNINVANPQEANELQIFNEAQGGAF